VENWTEAISTTKNTGGAVKEPLKDAESFIDAALIPEDGIAIYVAGASKPYYVRVEDELIIGRKFEEVSDSFLDLSDADAFNQGLSRRHAMIRRTETGFDIVDLASTNGTRLNGERLVPHKPYPLASGSQLRFGRMQLFVLYRASLQM
jgi:pSer/pThr/pTyr-binding forkhead associated (FHA) protein